MAVAESAGNAATSRDLQLQELIFSCCVCQATVSEIYAAREHNKGFHSGSGDNGGVVIRLWIAECAHAFCGKHLEGGGMLTIQRYGRGGTNLEKLRHFIPKANNPPRRVPNASEKEATTQPSDFSASEAWWRASMIPIYPSTGFNAHP